MNKFGFNQKAAASVERGRGAGSPLKITGIFEVEHWDAKGNLKGKYTLPNGVTNGGKDDALDVLFDAATQHTVWYLGLIDTGATLAAADVMSSHAGWTEVTAYDEATRPIWNPDPASGQAISNSVTTDFTMNASNTIFGVFAVTENTKSGTTGILWATAGFASEIPVANTDILKVTYTVTAA